MKQSKKTLLNESIFKDREEEARFWEGHFNEEFTDGKPIKVTFSKNLSQTLNVRLDPETISIVRHEAEAKGLGPTQLIRMWIMERISQGSANSVRM